MTKSKAKNMGGVIGAAAAKFGGMRFCRGKGSDRVEKLAKTKGKLKRGQHVVAPVKATYGAGKTYDATDVLAICRAIDVDKAYTKGDMWKLHLKGKWIEKYQVPVKTIYRWLGKEKGSDAPRWRTLEESRSLPRMGRAQPLLGRADGCLARAVVLADLMHRPLNRTTIENVARDIAIKLKLTDPRTGKRYTRDSNMDNWFRSFMDRCKAMQFNTKCRKGHGLGAQRVAAESIEIVEYYVNVASIPHHAASFFFSRKLPRV